MNTHRPHLCCLALWLGACGEGSLDPAGVYANDGPATDGGASAAPAELRLADPEPLEPVRFACDDDDDCPMTSGVTYACKQRFALGMNYAWRNFAGDFGGAFGRPGVASDRAGYRADLQRMKDHGASVVRWWMFPDFRGDGVVFDGADPIGLSQAAADDVLAALELAEETNVYLVLTPFSFDNFRPDASHGGRVTLGLTPMVKDRTRRAQLVDAIVGTAARVVASSEFAHRLFGWDVINEPEWAIQPGAGGPAGGDFTPNAELAWVTLDEMKALINESLAVMRQETPHALLSVGWAAAKWQWAFDDVTEVDFHQPHIYTWVNEYWPYTATPAELGYDDKPTVMGEFFLAEMPFRSSSGRPGSTSASFGDIVGEWWSNGYAGAWAWSLSDAGDSLHLVESVANARGCAAEF